MKGLYLRVTKTGEHVWFVRTTNWEGKQVKVNFGMILPDRYAAAAQAGKYPVYKRIEDVRLHANIAIANTKTPPVVKQDLRTSIDAYLKASLANGDHKQSTSDEYRRLFGKALAVYGHHDIWTELDTTFWIELYYGLALDPIQASTPAEHRAVLLESNFGTHRLLNKQTRFFGKSQAHKIFQLVSGMYTYCCSLDSSREHPIKKYTMSRKGRKKGLMRKPNSRTNILQPQDFKPFIESMSHVEKHGKIKTRPLLLCLFQGFRPAASVNLKISDFNLEAKVLYVDGDVTGFKGTDAPAIPVSGWVIENIIKPQIEEAKKRGADVEYLTPNLQDYTQPAAGDYSGLLESMYQYHKRTGPNGKPFLAADLRRTFGTYAKIVSKGDDTVWKRLMTHKIADATGSAPLSRNYFITTANTLRPYVEKISRIFREFAEISPLRQETYDYLYDIGEGEFAEYLRKKSKGMPGSEPIADYVDFSEF
jgi:integrase